MSFPRGMCLLTVCEKEGNGEILFASPTMAGLPFIHPATKNLIDADEEQDYLIAVETNEGTEKTADAENFESEDECSKKESWRPFISLDVGNRPLHFVSTGIGDGVPVLFSVQYVPLDWTSSSGNLSFRRTILKVVYAGGLHLAYRTMVDLEEIEASLEQNQNNITLQDVTAIASS